MPHKNEQPSEYGYYQCPKCKSTLMVEYPKQKTPLRATRLRTSPRTRAGISRTAKTIFFYVLGFALAIAAFAVVGVLSDNAIPDWLVQVTGLAIAGITAGVYKAINWKETGVDMSLLPSPTASANLPQLSTPESLLEQGKEEENVNT